MKIQIKDKTFEFTTFNLYQDLSNELLPHQLELILHFTKQEVDVIKDIKLFFPLIKKDTIYISEKDLVLFDCTYTTSEVFPTDKNMTILILINCGYFVNG